ncbi:MAG TPA: GNAT family N-acetyltransferase [Roseiflexaceae bacterium]|nr:GNAT family N-acetyltransferase [Roseiflexaceae bacterium]
MQIEFRQSQADDAPAYRALRMQALREHPEAFGADVAESEAIPLDTWRSRLEPQPEESATAATFVAQAGEALVGMMTIVRMNGAKVRHSANIYAVYVDPVYRGQRIGEQLLAICADWAARRGVMQIKLSVTTTNQSARRLYERCGFEVYGTDPAVLKLGDTFYDEYLMVRTLPKL